MFKCFKLQTAHRLYLFLDATAENWSGCDCDQLSMHSRDLAEERLQPNKGRVAVVFLVAWSYNLVAHHVEHLADVRGRYLVAQCNQAATQSQTLS